MTARSLRPDLIYGSTEYRAGAEAPVRFPSRHLGSGTTRHVYRFLGHAVKVPNLNKRPSRWRGMFLRGVLANRSEWKQRRRSDVLAPRFTLFWVAQFYPIAEPVPERMWPTWNKLMGPTLEAQGYRYDERKPSSWCEYPRLALIDYDRTWDKPLGLLGRYQEHRDEIVEFFHKKGLTGPPGKPRLYHRKNNRP